jgi:hypothetical protein
MAKPAAAPVTVLIKDLRLGIDVFPPSNCGTRILDRTAGAYIEL